MCYVGPMLRIFIYLAASSKIGMVRLDTCIDGVGGFPDSNMNDTNNSSLKNHTYRLINVLHRANVEIF